MELIYPKDQIKKFLLYKQLLLKPREISGDEGIKKVFQSLRSLQYDPQNPCGRSIDISLQARVSGINPSDYHRWLYEEKNGIEVYDKELCVIPIEDLTLRGGRFSPARRKKLDCFINNNKTKLKELLIYIEKKGSVCSYDLDGEEKVDIFWEPTRWSKVALDSLWKIGELVIVNRKNGRKYFDLPYRVYGKSFVWEDKGDNQINNKQIKKRIASTGLLPKSGTGSGWLGVGTGKMITPLLRELIQDKKLLEIKIEGLNNLCVIDYQDLGLLNGINKISYDKKVSFLSPLDNLLWDRQLIKDIFGFDYKWEAYTPPQLRKYGHYVLPVLYGTNFIGRIEPKYDLNETVLKINGFWLEENRKWNKEINLAFYDYLNEFKTYLGAGKIVWLCKKPK